LAFSNEGKALTNNSYQFKEYGLRKILAEFSRINCKREGLHTLMKKIREAGSTDQRHESGKPSTEENVTTIWMN